VVGHIVSKAGWFIFMQILGSIGSVGGGLALGKEGPLVHTGACIASVLGQVCSTACHGRIIVCVLVCKV
jgi:H+/Cl- antiporter ClcA